MTQFITAVTSNIGLLIGGVVLTGIVIFWAWHVYNFYKRRTNCCYDDIDFLVKLDEPIFDVFVSYKSDDVHFARAVVDRLLASGLRVWFAEYCIRTPDDDDEFERRINCGVHNSRAGLLITSPAYFESYHTLNEFNQLLVQLG